MRKIFMASLLLAGVIASASAQTVSLPAPEKTGGMPINQVLSERRSVRSFDSSKELNRETASGILWAACGVNRPESGMRTNPTARNFQEITAYWFDGNGVYEYDALNNSLIEIAKGDHRSLVAGAEFKQDFVMDALAAVVLVADTTKTGLTAALIDAGIACENINLFCVGNGLATVPRMTMDVNGIQKLLNLPDTSLPVINNPVGYAK